MNKHEACNVAMAHLSRAWRMNSYTQTTTAATLHTCHAHLPMACHLPTKVCAVLPGSRSRFSAYSTMCEQINFPHASDTQAAALECHAHIGSPVRHTTCEHRKKSQIVQSCSCSNPSIASRNATNASRVELARSIVTMRPVIS